jgi:hypothetical protein
MDFSVACNRAILRPHGTVGIGEPKAFNPEAMGGCIGNRQTNLSSPIEFMDVYPTRSRDSPGQRDAEVRSLPG